MDSIIDAVGVIGIVAVGATAAIGALAAFLSFQIGRRRGASGAEGAIKRLELERDGVANELSEAALDLRDAQKTIAERDADIQALKEIVGDRALEVGRLERRLSQVTRTARSLGGEYESYRARLRAAVDGEIWTRSLPDEERQRHEARDKTLPVIAIGNLKGGVGKSTIAANLGAYFADTSPDGPGVSRRVLFIDLDFQGTLSSTLLSVSGAGAENRTAALFEEDQSAEHLLALAPPLNMRRLNGGCRFFDCGLAAAEREERLLFDWVSREAVTRDMRLTLSAFLSEPSVRRSFDLVVLDLPPRASAFSYNALAAATHLIIASKHDVVSADAIGRYVDFVDQLRPAICPDLKLLGVAPNMLRPQDSSRAFVEPVMLDAARRWGGGGPAVMLPPIPLRAAVNGAAGRSFAYLDDAMVRRAFADLGRAVEDAMMSEEGTDAPV